MATITWSVEKKTFVPEKNYFKCENVKVSREETKEEIELYDKMIHYDNLAVTLAIILSISGVLGALIGGGLLINFVSKAWGTFCAIFCVNLGLSSIPVFRILGGKSDKYKVAWDKYRKDHDVWNTSPSAMEVQAWNDEQERIAEEWRAAHPLEEKIRACIKDPMSSVEVANLARYYAEEYLRGQTNENS